MASRWFKRTGEGRRSGSLRFCLCACEYMLKRALVLVEARRGRGSKSESAHLHLSQVYMDGSGTFHTKPGAKFSREKIFWVYWIVFLETMGLQWPLDCASRYARNVPITCTQIVLCKMRQALFKYPLWQLVWIMAPSLLLADWSHSFDSRQC